MPIFEAFEGLSLGPMLLGIVGGLALFLHGMAEMTDALKAVAGEGMSRLLERFTSNRFSAAVTGALVTAVIQSSSVTTVLIVGFVSAGLMTATQSVGVIMGANVGSTITAQIVAFKVTESALLLIAGGFAARTMGRHSQVKQFGTMAMGLGLLFLGMTTMSQATDPLRTHGPFIEMVRTLDSPLPAIGIAAAFTALIQSSSATTGIVVVLASQGFITLEVGILLSLGANIGTCITALLAAAGQTRTALQSALIHVLFNTIGALIWLPLVDHLAAMASAVSPAFPELEGTARVAAEAPRQIANAHTLFNLINTLLFLPFAGGLVKVAGLIVPERPDEDVGRDKPRFLDPVYLDTPALAIDRLELELGHFGDHVVAMVEATAPRADRKHRFDIERAVVERARLQTLHDAILEYLRAVNVANVSAREAHRLETLITSLTQLNNIAMTVVVNLGALASEQHDHQLRMSDETRRLFAELHALVVESLRLVVDAVREWDRDRAEEVIARKVEISDRADALAGHLSTRLASSDQKRIPTFRVESANIEVLKRIYYFTKRVAKAISGDAPDPEPERLSDAPPPPPSDDG